jgi:uncharacterized protein YcbK (DUF882 family)
VYFVKGLSNKASPNFYIKEFDCKCGNIDCNVTVMHSKVFELLEKLRAEAGVPLKINSAYRCEKHNKKVGGAPKSQHLLGSAVDISAKNIDRFRLADLARKHFKFVKVYETFVHMDLRLTDLATDD